MIFISLGSWCGVAIALNGLNLRTEAYPFDMIRSKFEGIIDCFENDFINFFPTNIKLEKIGNYDAFRNQYFGFFHHNLFDQNIQETFKRRIERLITLLKTTNEKIFFLRTICEEKYEDEIKFNKQFQSILENKYPNLNYLIIYIKPQQSITGFHSKIDNKAYLFTIGDESDINKSPLTYKIIINDLLNNYIHKKNNNYKIINNTILLKVGNINFYTE